MELYNFIEKVDAFPIITLSNLHKERVMPYEHNGSFNFIVSNFCSFVIYLQLYNQHEIASIFLFQEILHRFPVIILFNPFTSIKINKFIYVNFTFKIRTIFISNCLTIKFKA